MRINPTAFLDWLGGKFKSYDRFGAGVSFNIAGDSVVRSYWGATVSIFCNIVLLFYAWEQFQYLWGRTKFVYNAELQDYLTQDNTTINFKENGLKFALALVDVDTQEVKESLNYITFKAQIIRGFGVGDIDFPLVQCDEKDWEEFYPPSIEYASKINKIKEKGAFLCVETEDQLEIFGPEGSSQHSYFDIAAYACDYTTNSTCNYDMDSMKAYLEGTEVAILANKQYFNSEDLNPDTKVVKESILVSQQILPELPRYSRNFITQNRVFDLTSLVQVGQYDLFYFYDIKGHALEASVYRDFPANYKLSSYMVYLDQNLYKVTRKTYDVMSFLGSVGGIQYNFDVIAGYVCAWFAATNARYFLNNQLYTVHDREYKKQRIIGVLDYKDKQKSDEIWRSQIASDYVGRQDIEFFNIFIYIFNCCCRWYRFNRSQRILKKGVSRMSQELDILNHIRQSRLQALQIRTLLTKKQHALSRKMSEFIITDEESSTDDELHHAKTLQRSNTMLQDLNRPGRGPIGGGGAFKQAMQNKFFQQLQKSLHVNWHKPSSEEPLPDLVPFMESNDKVDVRMVNLIKTYDAVRIKRWSDVFVPPMLLNTEDEDENGKVNLKQHKEPLGFDDTDRGGAGGIELSSLLSKPKQSEQPFGQIFSPGNSNGIAPGAVTDDDDVENAFQDSVKNALSKVDKDHK